MLGAVTRHATIAGVGSSLPPRLVPEHLVRGLHRHERRVDPGPHGHRGPPLRRGRGADERPRRRSGARRRSRRPGGARAARHDRGRRSPATPSSPRRPCGCSGSSGVSCPRSTSTRRVPGSATGCRRRPRSSPRAWPTRSCWSAPRSSAASSTTPTAAPASCSATAPAPPWSPRRRRRASRARSWAPTATRPRSWMPAGGTRTPASAETVEANDHTVRMPNGREVFKRAVTEVAAACRELLEKSGTQIDDVDVLIPHQANARIMSAVVDRLGIDPAKAVVDVAVGNTSAASIPIALDRAWRAGTIGRATWCCSRRSARGSRGAPRWCAGRCRPTDVGTSAPAGHRHDVEGRRRHRRVARHRPGVLDRPRRGGWTVAVGCSDEAAAKAVLGASRPRAPRGSRSSSTRPTRRA